MDSVVHRRNELGDGAPAAERGVWLVVAALLALAALTVGLPAVTVLMGMARWATRAGAESAPAWGGAGVWLLLRTAGYALGIGALATALAWPVAWAIGRGAGAWRGVLAVACAVPLLLPNYLAYAALNLLRAPRSSLGDWLAVQDAWMRVGAGKLLAVVGLALWAWPLAVLVLAPAAGRIPRETLDALELDSAGAMWRVRRMGSLATMLRGPIAVAIAIVAVVMLGSAVPLHVAQVETFATRLWFQLMLTTDPAPAWIGAWPLMLVAVAVAAAVSTRLQRIGDEEEPGDGSPGAARRGWWVAGSAWGVWALSVVAPTALFAASLREPGRAWTVRDAAATSAAFWRDAGEAVAASASSAALVGCIGVAISAMCWAALSSVGVRRRAIVVAVLGCIAAWIVAGLSPGVLVGSAVVRTWGTGALGGLGGLGDRVSDSAALLVLAHVARFGLVAALVGWWLAALETRSLRDLRRLDGGGGVRGWWLTRVGVGSAGAVVGAGLAVAALSFHEIEAAVMVQPPGLASLPQQLLEDLHFARDARLSAAAVNLVVAGVVLVGLAGWLVVRGTRVEGMRGRSAPRGAEF